MTKTMGIGGGRTVRSFSQDRSIAKHELRRGTLPRIARLAHPYRRKLAAFLALILLDALCAAATPLLLREIIDRGIVEGRTGLIAWLAVGTAGLAIVSAAGSLAQRWFSASIGEGLVRDLRTALFDHIQRLPITFFTRARTGALLARINGDVQGAQQAFTSTMSNVVGNAAGVAVTVAAMLVLSWRLTVLALVLVPLFLLPARLVGRRLQTITRERYALDAEMGHLLNERLDVSGALLVKLFGRDDDESTAFAARAHRLGAIGVTTAMYSRVFMTSLTLLAALATALVYGVGGTLAAEGAIGVGTLVALTTYLSRLYGPLTSLSNVQVDVMTTLVSFERVFEVLDLEPAIADQPSAATLRRGPAAVELDRVSFRYPTGAEVSLRSLEGSDDGPDRVGEEVLHDVTFTVAPGELVALVGPSGAGKTTITGLIARLHDATAGSVRVGGHDVRDVTQRSLRQVVGVVPQDAHLFHDTLRANLRYAAPNATDDELEAALRAAQVWDVVQRLPEGLGTVVGDRGHRLSGGEKQRIAIARLLLKDPSVVVLDEATAHLDAESEAAIQDALSIALAGRTSIVIAHRLATVRSADQILVVDGGRIVERGRHDELVAAGGRYAELSRTQLL